MKPFQFPLDRQTLIGYIGDMSQVAGAKRYYFADGKSAGMEAVDVATGSGFQFTVLPGRGMDIAWASYKGFPIAYISKVGMSGPAYYESAEKQWLRSFTGGLLSTCGLSNVGNPCEEDLDGVGPQKYGLHGRIGNQPADQICVNEDWEDSQYVIHISGRLREAQLLGEKLTLRRSIRCNLGENRLFLRDIITNEDRLPHPMMIMYHINFGYPLLCKDARLVVSKGEMYTDDSWSEQNAAKAYEFSDPIHATRENLYFHTIPGKDGKAAAAIINDAVEIGAYIRYNSDQLPYLTEWKMMGEVDYVVGIEPGNCIPRGRVYHRQREMLRILTPGESVCANLEIGILPDAYAIVEFEKSI